MSETTQKLSREIQKEFESNRTLLTFDQYLDLLKSQPTVQLRGSGRYCLEMIEHFGKQPLPGSTAAGPYRFEVFENPPRDGVRPVVGHHEVQNKIYEALRTFSRIGRNHKLILLHGPNGSAKSSIVQALMAGLERYSELPEGAVYTFNWVFPHERSTKGEIGFGSSSKLKDVSSYALLADEEIQCRIPSELRDHPLLLIPQQHRKKFLVDLLGGATVEKIWAAIPELLKTGQLSHRSQQIFDALSTAYKGDLAQVLMHAQIERVYLSSRFRRGLVTVEPQMHVDAQYQQLTLNRSMSNLPAALTGMNLFATTGDLVDSARGLTEFSDLLKRPIDTFKYLLIACETNTVGVGPTIVNLDSVFIGSTNELQLDAFKEFPDFTSFKGRIDLIRVPYLLNVSDETKIYERDLAQVRAEKHVAPHVAWTLALWAVLTRLKKPNTINYPPQLSSVLSSLTPLDKARMYDTGELPPQLSSEDRKLLKANIKRIRDEYQNIPYYEGRVGASAREMLSALHSVAANPANIAVTPLGIMRELEELSKRVSEYEFLRQDVKDGYHDVNDFIRVVRGEYLERIDREVRDAVGILESRQYEELIKKYVQHLSTTLKKEKIRNTMTGKSEDPDPRLLQEFEKTVAAPNDPAQLDVFRQSVLSQLGAWALDHPNEPVVYGKVFPEFWRKIESEHYEAQKAVLTKMHAAMVMYDKEPSSALEEGWKVSQRTIQNMITKYGYCEHSAKEVIGFLIKQRY